MRCKFYELYNTHLSNTYNNIAHYKCLFKIKFYIKTHLKNVAAYGNDTKKL